MVRVYIGETDQQRATLIAAGIFARRAKIKSHPRQQMPKDEPDRTYDIDFSPFTMS